MAPRPASDLAAQDPPRHPKLHHHSESDDIKNSEHAATWSSYAQQEMEQSPDADTVPKKLDPALMAGAERLL